MRRDRSVNGLPWVLQLLILPTRCATRWFVLYYLYVQE